MNRMKHPMKNQMKNKMKGPIKNPMKKPVKNPMKKPVKKPMKNTAKKPMKKKVKKAVKKKDPKKRTMTATNSSPKSKRTSGVEQSARPVMKRGSVTIQQMEERTGVDRRKIGRLLIEWRIANKPHLYDAVDRTFTARGVRVVRALLLVLEHLTAPRRA